MFAFAHRGHHESLKENTLPAFESAVTLGFPGIELDLQSSRDEHVIIYHDERLSSGEAIRDLDFLEIRARAPWIPSFEEFTDRFVSERIVINFEIKDSRATYHRVRESLRRFFNPVVSSFRLEIALESYADGLETGFLFDTWEEYEIQKDRIPGDRIHLSFRAALNAPAGLFRNCRLFCYTVNEKGLLERLMKIPGFVGIFTDVSDLKKLPE